MGFRARWTEEQFEEWFHTRFNQWINERFNAEFDERLQAWADRADGQFQERLDASFSTRFEVGFREQIRAWQDRELKRGFDAWVEHWFDLLFTVWANTWAGSKGFRERFDERFDTLFQERLEGEVRARVANEINTRIDGRIEQWLLAVRRELLDATPDTGDQSGTSAHRTSAAEPADEVVATAAQLAEYLAKRPLGPKQIRRILKGKELPGSRPSAYPLGDAAATLLLRNGRQTNPVDPEGRTEHPSTPDA